MPWKEWPVSEQRLVLVHRVLQFGQSVSAAARELGVSRKTAYKWITRHRADPAATLADRSRRPRRSPQRTSAGVEAAVLAVADRYRWGARKIHRLLSDDGQTVPSIRTTAAILKRHHRVGSRPPPLEQATTRFERPRPNDLWQLDHKGPVEIARRKYMPLAVIDDHSRYCLCFAPAADKSMPTTWSMLWNVFGEVGLPAALLCDNAFSAPIGLSWFDAQLVRLGIRPIHGRPYHPQTQGKVERLSGTAQRELIGFAARRDSVENFCADATAWRHVYNTIRPHESLGDAAPMTRWTISPRRRPDTLPPVTYPAGALLRKVTQVGDVYYHQIRILVGVALAREFVRIEERADEIAIYYSTHLVRVIAHTMLTGKRTYKRI
jgi:transposase InsO family protein